MTEELPETDERECQRRLIAVSNQRPVDHSLMMRLAAAVGGLPDGQRNDFRTRCDALVKTAALAMPTAMQSAIIDTAMSFDFRMSALTRLRDRPEYRQFAIPGKGPGDPDIVEECMLAAAGLADLVERDGRPSFEPGPFFQLALILAPTEGRA